MKKAQAGLASPLGQSLFLTGKKIPMPEKMRKVFDSAKSMNLTNLEGCQKFGDHLVLLEKMLRAVALYGVNSLDKFPG